MGLVAKVRMYLNADKTKVVDEHDASAAYLLAGVGAEIPEEYADMAKAYMAEHGGEAPAPASSDGEGTTGEEAADEGGKKSGKGKKKDDAD